MRGNEQRILWVILEAEYETPLQVHGTLFHHHSVQMVDQFKRDHHTLLVKGDQNYLFQVQTEILFQMKK